MQLIRDKIEDLSYTEFVGLVNQWNVPPGAFDTISKWCLFGEVDEDSTVLEAACTTGFSSREIAVRTGAEALGFDLCESSVAAARHNAARYAGTARLTYHAADVMQFEPKRSFSHVVTGAALRFFPEPGPALRRMTGWLEPNGALLSCEFYAIEPVPDSLLSEAYEVFGIKVTQQPYKEVMALYRDLALVYEERNRPEPETASELEHYCDSLVARFSEDNPEAEGDALEAVRRRLLTIKDVSNRLRPYQGYNVLVHKRDPRFYPRRYTELF